MKYFMVSSKLLTDNHDTKNTKQKIFLDMRRFTALKKKMIFVVVIVIYYTDFSGSRIIYYARLFLCSHIWGGLTIFRRDKNDQRVSNPPTNPHGNM